MQSLKVVILFAIVLTAQQASAGPLIGQQEIPIIGLNAENEYVQPEPRNLLGDVLGGVGTGLGDLANAITSLSVSVSNLL